MASIAFTSREPDLIYRTTISLPNTTEKSAQKPEVHLVSASVRTAFNTEIESIHRATIGRNGKFPKFKK